MEVSLLLMKDAIFHRQKASLCLSGRRKVIGKKLYFSLAPMKDTCLSSAWFGQQKVQFPETKKKKRKTMLHCQRCQTAARPARSGLDKCRHHQRGREEARNRCCYSTLICAASVGGGREEAHNRRHHRREEGGRRPSATADAQGLAIVREGREEAHNRAATVAGCSCEATTTIEPS
jgi:hypothetical protein